MANKNTQKKKKPENKNIRLFWADVVRVLAIFLVVLDHNNFISQNTSFGNQAAGYFISSLARLGVPLFVIVSGALLLRRQTSYVSFFQRRIVRVLIPWVLWACIYTIWFFYTRDVSGDIVSIGRLFYQTFFGQFWYLWMLWGLYLLTPILWKLIASSKSIDIKYVIGLWFVFASFLPFVSHLVSPYSPVSQAYVFLHLGFYVLGYYVVSFQKVLSKIILGSVFFVSLLLQTVGLWFLDLMDPSVKFLNTNLSVFIVFASVSLFIFLYQVFQEKKYDLSRVTHRVLSFLSGASFFVFLSHGIMMEILRNFQGLIPFQGNSIFFLVISVNTFTVIFSCLVLYLLIQRIRIVNVLLGAKNS